MIKKQKLVKLCISVFLLAVVFLLGFTSAVSLKIELPKGTVNLDNLSPVHFNDNGNDFGGFLFFSNGRIVSDRESQEEIDGDDEGQESSVSHTIDIQIGDVTYKCKEKMEGFYYNSERGERLWPLDDATKTDWHMNDVIIQGGLYTVCTKDGYDKFVNDCDSYAEGLTADHLKNENELDENYEPTDDELDKFKQEKRSQCIEEGEGEYVDNYSYYGTIVHEYKNQKYGLVAGIKYKYDDGEDWVSEDMELSPTFQRFDNIYPIGFIYDYHGGVGFVGCNFTDNDGSSLRSIANESQSETFTGIVNYFKENTKYNEEDPSSGDKIIISEKGEGIGLKIKCENIGSAGNSLSNVIVDGLIGMSNEAEFGVITKNNSKMQYFSSANINNATLMNFARQKANTLCRGKRYNAVPDSIDMDTDIKIICIDGKNGNITVDATNSSLLGKTLIVKNGNVSVKPANDVNDINYDIFVDNGSLKIDESGNPKQFVFKYNGFISDQSVPNFNDTFRALYQSEIYHNQGEEVAVGVLLKGNFIVNGDIEALQNYYLNNKYFIYGKLNVNSLENLSDAFYWRCRNRNGSDGNHCPDSCSGCPYKHSYSAASLVVIDQNYDSPLFW